MYYRHVRGILESSAYDPDKMVAPKNYWFSGKILEAWYEERRNASKTTEAT